MPRRFLECHSSPPTASLSFLHRELLHLMVLYPKRPGRGHRHTQGWWVREGDPWALASSPGLFPKVSCSTPNTVRGQLNGYSQGQEGGVLGPRGVLPS